MLALVVSLSGCISSYQSQISQNGTATNNHNFIVSRYQDIVDSMHSMVKDLQIPAHFNTNQYPPMYPADVQRAADDFDVNNYLTVLNHLSLEPGYTLDYLYNKNNLEAKPYIYARKITDLPFKSISEYRATIIASQNSSVIVNENEKLLYSYLDHIKVDDTPEGFFQFVAVRIMGAQYYLWWHAIYNDQLIICNEKAVENILASVPPSPDEVKTKLLKQLPQFDLEPKIEIQGNVVKVRVITFTRFGGIIQRDFTIARQFPHAVSNSEEKNLIRYSGGAVP
jgi:hypothetical protein